MLNKLRQISGKREHTHSHTTHKPNEQTQKERTATNRDQKWNKIHEKNIGSEEKKDRKRILKRKKGNEIKKKEEHEKRKKKKTKTKTKQKRKKKLMTNEMSRPELKSSQKKKLNLKQKQYEPFLLYITQIQFITKGHTISKQFLLKHYIL